MCGSPARCGVGSLTLVDRDVVSATNINRQLFALHSTIGRKSTGCQGTDPGY